MADEIKKDNICAICQSTYTKPRILSCFHIFCTPCLEELIKDKTALSCPLCRTCYNGQIVDLALYPYSDFRESESETKKSLSLCQMCEETDVYSKCIDCDQSMCRDCHQYHLRNKVFRSHKIEVNTDQETDRFRQNENKCNEHEKDVFLYCKACNLAICKECAESTHKCHKTQHLKTFVRTMRGSLRVSIQGVKSQLPFIRNFIENAKAESNKYLSYVEQTKNEIKIAAADIKKALCESIDIVLEQNLLDFDNYARCDNQMIGTYIGNCENKELALIELLKYAQETEAFSDDQAFGKCTNALRRQLDLNARNSFQTKLKIGRPRYHPGKLLTKPIQECVGNVVRETMPLINLELQLPRFDMSPHLTIAIFSQIARITVRQNCRSICSASDIQVFVSVSHEIKQTSHGPLFDGYVYGLFMDGTPSLQNKFPGLQFRSIDAFHVIGCWTGKIYVWHYDTLYVVECDKIGRILESCDITKLIQTFPTDCITCITNKGDLLIYKPSYNQFQVCSHNGDVLSSFSDKIKISTPRCILLTHENFILMVTKTNIYLFDMLGELRYTHEACSADFRAVCQDGSGNVFLADYKNNKIWLLAPDGSFDREVLLEADCIKKPLSLTIDGCGNLWVLMENSTILVFSYL